MSANPHEKLIYMANQISKFFESKPEAEGVAGIVLPQRIAFKADKGELRARRWSVRPPELP